MRARRFGRPLTRYEAGLTSTRFGHGIGACGACTIHVDGQPKDLNLDSYTPLRMSGVPDMAIEFIASTEAPVGLGEPATTVVGPTIGNAIYRAVGARVRDLPIRLEAVKAGIRKA